MPALTEAARRLAHGQRDWVKYQVIRSMALSDHTSSFMRLITNIDYQYPSQSKAVAHIRIYIYDTFPPCDSVIHTISIFRSTGATFHLHTALYTYSIYTFGYSPPPLPIETIEKPYWADVAVHQTIPYASSLRNMHIIAYTKPIPSCGSLSITGSRHPAALCTSHAPRLRAVSPDTQQMHCMEYPSSYPSSRG